MVTKSRGPETFFARDTHRPTWRAGAGPLHRKANVIRAQPFLGRVVKRVRAGRGDRQLSIKTAMEAAWVADPAGTILSCHRPPAIAQPSYLEMWSRAFRQPVFWTANQKGQIDRPFSWQASRPTIFNLISKAYIAAGGCQVSKAINLKVA